MDFRIADTFTASMAKLTNDEQKLVKTTAFDLQVNPASPGHQLHRLDRAKDKQFWSVRVGRDIRLIVHKSAASLLLCYVGHHDDAYACAERRKIERHPTTGAAQLVEIRERVQEVVVPHYAEVAKTAPTKLPLLAKTSDEELLRYGVPAEWLADARRVTDDTLLELTSHLPQEAAEALFDLATGQKPKISEVVSTVNPFDHPAAQQRFRLMTDVEELRRALNAPWDRWTVFLHPDQHSLVKKQFNGPARVAGSAGTGKTVVALHRTVWLARQDAKATVLLTTFSDVLARMLKSRLEVLTGNDQRLLQRITVGSIDSVGLDLYRQRVGDGQIAPEADIRVLLRSASRNALRSQFSEAFIWSEWANVVDAWQLTTWLTYRDVPRIGRKTRLTEAQRRRLWDIFDRVETELAFRGQTTLADVFSKIADADGDTARRSFDFIVVDEAQDISVAQLRFLASLAGKRPNGLFFTGDLGQRIFQSPFSWKSIGVDVRGRSHTLRVNYRTSHQIRRQADRLLPNTVSDVDGTSDDRDRTISVFNGPAPTIVVCQSEAEECKIVSAWLAARADEGIQPHEMAVFARSNTELDRAVRAVETNDRRCYRLNDNSADHLGIAVGTMHQAKGLEFKAVVVMACDEQIIPSAERVEAVADEADLKDAYDTERHLLYVACTRARDQLLVTGIVPGSEFLDDLLGK